LPFAENFPLFRRLKIGKTSSSDAAALRRFPRFSPFQTPLYDKPPRILYAAAILLQRNKRFTF